MSAVADPELLSEFLVEAGELLESVDRKLVELEQRPSDAGLLNDIFRGFHTIKGGAGFLDATPLVEVCHKTESLFDGLRSGKRALCAEMLDVILSATAVVRRMFDELGARGQATPAEPALMAALAGWLVADAITAPDASSAAPAKATPKGSEPDWQALYAAVTGKPLVLPAPASSAAAKAVPPASSAKMPPAKESTMRIDVGRFDQILNLSGEIGLTKNRLSRLRTELCSGTAGAEGLKELDEIVNALATLVGDLQNSVMKARMQPVGRVFQKYTRLARDLARSLGKEVEFVIEGEETEIDKTMLEELNDPIVHLVRNAVDHGVDSPEERAAAGKPAKAIVRLSAQQVGDSIVVSIADDGRGMNPERLRLKALEKGLIGADEAATMDDCASLELIFLPGFSTKSAISDVSGRGVGMDVVRNNVRRLSGSIGIDSAPGRGTTIRIVLPLTLAILPVLMFRLQCQPYAIPLALVREIVRIAPADIRLVSGRRSLLMRGQVMPVIDVAELLGRERDANEIGVVVQMGMQSLVLAVDSFVGQDEVVIKALEGFKPKGVAGATLGADGALVLVLDLAQLLAERTLKLAA
jgi:two-component system chemotaxis sensor kinase CheA